MKFITKQIGSAKESPLIESLPVLSLEVPVSFSLLEGFYAVWVEISETMYPAMLRYGLIFDKEMTHVGLEVYMTDATIEELSELDFEAVTVSVVKRVGDILNSTSLLKRKERLQLEMVLVNEALTQDELEENEKGEDVVL